MLPRRLCDPPRERLERSGNYEQAHKDRHRKCSHTEPGTITSRDDLADDETDECYKQKDKRAVAPERVPIPCWPVVAEVDDYKVQGQSKQETGNSSNKQDD